MPYRERCCRESFDEPHGLLQQVHSPFRPRAYPYDGQLRLPGMGQVDGPLFQGDRVRVQQLVKYVGAVGISPACSVATIVVSSSLIPSLMVGWAMTRRNSLEPPSSQQANRLSDLAARASAGSKVSRNGIPMIARK